MARRIGASVGVVGLLAACQAAPPPFVPGEGASLAPSPSVGPSSPEPMASRTPEAGAPLPEPSPLSPAPVMSAPSHGIRKVVLSGRVHDLEGNAWLRSRGDIAITSLDPNWPYASTTSTSEGWFVFNDVPPGVLCRLVLSKEGHATRQVVLAWQAESFARNVQDFGGNAWSAWPQPALALTNQPEVAEVVASASGLRVRLSEPLNAPNRARFAQALRLLPTRDPGASPAGVGQDFALGAGLSAEGGDRLRWPFAWRPDPQATGPAQAWPEAMPQGSLGASEASPIGALVWNAAGDEALWSWGVAPPGAGQAGVGHQLALVVGAAPIQDGEGLAMGLPGVQAGLALPAGKLLPLAFYQDPPATLPAAELPLVAPIAPERRWAWVHRHAWPLSLLP